MIKLISSDMDGTLLDRKMVSILLSTQDVNIQMHAVLWKQPD